MAEYKIVLGGRELIVKSGEWARQAYSCTVRYGDTMLLASALASPKAIQSDFVPLTVEYEERHYAIGAIPGSFHRREGRPSERATLAARLTDRPMRPLFPQDLRNEVQIVITVLSADQVNGGELLGTIAASTATSISDIPWNGPIAAVRVGLLGGSFVLNPTLQELEASTLDLVVAGSKDAILMVECGANEVDEDTLVRAIEYGHREMQPVIALQERIRAELGSPKFELSQPQVDEALQAEVLAKARELGLKEAILTTGKHRRAEAIRRVQNAVVASLAPATLPDSPPSQVTASAQRLASIQRFVEDAEQAEMRRLVLEEGIRADGRKLAAIRPIRVELGVLPRAHGSAVFTRGETQVLGVTTLGTGRDERIVDDLSHEETEKFLLHYNFPPFSTGEVKRLRTQSRREIGHGALAKRALITVLPDLEDDFPYTVRVVGETLESNGSSSMATVCAGCLSLMDAGVPVRKPVAGIAMGLVKDGDRYGILSDILGLEDALGDMDFKVCGTREGVTALQMDIKIGGITPELMRAALEQARLGRLHVLDKMAEALPAPRAELNRNAPRIITVKIDKEKIGALIGPGGKNIRAIVDQTGAEVDVQDDGTVRIYSPDSSAAEAARARVMGSATEAEVGKTYQGTVVKIMPFGAFINILPGKDGMLHVSQMAEQRVERVEDIMKLGDVVEVIVAQIDERGRVDLTRPGIEFRARASRPPREGRGERAGRGRGARG